VDCSRGAAGTARWSTTIAAAEASSTPSKVPPSQPTADAIKPLLLDAPSDTSACSRRLQLFQIGCHGYSAARLNLASALATATGRQPLRHHCSIGTIFCRAFSWGTFPRMFRSCLRGYSLCPDECSSLSGGLGAQDISPAPPRSPRCQRRGRLLCGRSLQRAESLACISAMPNKPSCKPGARRTLLASRSPNSAT
jgi:hypothetical protein